MKLNIKKLEKVLDKSKKKQKTKSALKVDIEELKKILKPNEKKVPAEKPKNEEEKLEKGTLEEQLSSDEIPEENLNFNSAPLGNVETRVEQTKTEETKESRDKREEKKYEASAPAYDFRTRSRERTTTFQQDPTLKVDFVRPEESLDDERQRSQRSWTFSDSQLDNSHTGDMIDYEPETPRMEEARKDLKKRDQDAKKYVHKHEY